MLPYFLAAASIVVALLAFARARRVSRRFDRLTESYWELRYEQGQLRARLDRLEGVDAGDGDPHPQKPEKPAESSTFIPLTSLKK